MTKIRRPHPIRAAAYPSSISTFGFGILLIDLSVRVVSATSETSARKMPHVSILRRIVYRDCRLIRAGFPVDQGNMRLASSGRVPTRLDAGPLTRGDREAQPILRRRQRTGCVRRERARGRVGPVEVDDERAVRLAARAHEAPTTIVALPAGPETGAEPRVLELTFGISREIYANFLALREATEKEHDLDRVLPLILPRIVRGLGIALLVVLAFATVLGLGVARRAIGRVAALRDAAHRVGAGDLSVRVAPRGNDELDELARAFDVMVAELGDARSRLGYLQKVSAWQEVARRLAHEIKNPLTPIQLAVQELGSKYRGDDPEFRRLLATAQEILNEGVGAIRRLVDDFSAFAKLPKVEPAPVDLAQVVEDFARAHPEWQEFLEVERNGQVGALCDRMLLRNVLANLVENAVQAAEAAGRTPAIRIAVAPSPAERGARLTVEDNGPGVAADARERIFEPYVTTKENGTGLGLAIVRKIVLDHGGDVHVDEQPASLGGARFVVTLPTVEGERTSGPRAAATDDRRPR
jgi:signal transduction histidine kinase